MTSNKYIDLLESCVLDEIIKEGFVLRDVVFVQDNASCYTSSMSKNWFKDHKIPFSILAIPKPRYESYRKCMFYVGK